MEGEGETRIHESSYRRGVFMIGTRELHGAFSR